MHTRFLPMLAALLLVMMLAACGGGTEETTETSSAPAGDAEAPAAASADDGKGVGPIDHVDVAALDMSRSTMSCAPPATRSRSATSAPRSPA
jgi:hypothetical protein